MYTFRRELIKKVDEMTDEMYQTGKILYRHIPARPNGDYDLLVGELLIRFKENTQLFTKEDMVNFCASCLIRNSNREDGTVKDYLDKFIKNR